MSLLLRYAIFSTFAVEGSTGVGFNLDEEGFVPVEVTGLELSDAGHAEIDPDGRARQDEDGDNDDDDDRRGLHAPFIPARRGLGSGHRHGGGLVRSAEGAELATFLDLLTAIPAEHIFLPSHVTVAASRLM